VCSLTVILPSYLPIYVAAGIVRWTRGEGYGLEMLGVDDESREDVEQFIGSPYWRKGMSGRRLFEWSTALTVLRWLATDLGDIIGGTLSAD
jgi:hypothetical protein